MKIRLCWFLLSVALCSVTSFKIFPIANRRLSVSWNVEADDPSSTTESTAVVSITNLDISEEFTNSPESLLIISEVTASEEVDETTTETVKRLDVKNEDSEITVPMSATKSEELTTIEETTKASKESTRMTELSTENFKTTITPDEIVAVVSETASTKAETNVVNTEEAKIEVSTFSSFLETSSIPEVLSVNLLPPKTEYRKHDFDPRYDDWNKVPPAFNAI